MYQNLSHYISFLESEGELVRVQEPVNPILEISEVIDRISKSRGGGKAILFENTGTAFPLLINAWGSDHRIAYALGVDNVEEIPQAIDELFKQLSAPKISFWDKLKLLPTLQQVTGWTPKIVKNRKAPCQEVVMARPDLSALPILQCWPHDGGRFITLPMVHTKSLETGMRNLGMYRMQVFGESTTGMHWHKHKTGAKHFEEYKRIGQRMPVAVTLGGDPAYTWSATAPLPENLDEYLLAGFLRKQPVRLVSCLTQEIEVPEDVDFVLEGYIDPSEALVSEGPFGDHTGFYSLNDFYPKFHITCITHRKEAIYPATVVGIPPQEDAYMAKATERIFLAPIRMLIAPEVNDIYLPEEGVAHNIAIVSIDKSYPGQAVKVAHALWGAGQMMFCKVIIVTDADVEVHDMEKVLNAVVLNWNPSTDTYFTKGPLDVLDHAAQQMGFGGKMCIDATHRLPEEESTETDYEPDARFAQLLHAGQALSTTARVNIIFDESVDLNDVETCVWLASNNIDVARDCNIVDGRLVIDATIKTGLEGFHRPWPNVVCMDDQTIAEVDKKWESLSIGRFIKSPSLKYKHLLKKGGAAIEQDTIIEKQ